MGRLLDVVTGNKNGSVTRVTRQGSKVVAGRPTPILRSLFIARSVLADLARHLGLRHLALRPCHVVSAAQGVTYAMERSRSASMRSRQRLCWPGYSCDGRV